MTETVDERAAKVRATLHANPVLRLCVEYALAPDRPRAESERALWDAMVLACMYGMKQAAAELVALQRREGLQ